MLNHVKIASSKILNHFKILATLSDLMVFFPAAGILWVHVCGTNLLDF